MRIVRAGCVLLFLVMPGCSLIAEPPDLQTLHESRAIGTTEDLGVTLDYGIGKLDVIPASENDLFSFDLHYDKRRFDARFGFDEGDGHASMRLELDKILDLGGGRSGDNRLTLRLTEKVPLDLDITTGVSEAFLDLSNLILRRMHLKSGVGKTEVAFTAPATQPVSSIEVETGVGEFAIRGLGNARVERLDLKGGVGSVELDYTGNSGEMRNQTSIQVGIGKVRLLLPRTANVEILGEGGFLSTIDAPSFTKSGPTYMHHGGGQGAITIRVQSGIGQVEVDLR